MLSLFLFYVLFCFFFFKQKTAYEMRISDWSSDVCSSDLNPPSAVGIPRVMRRFSTERYFSNLTPSASTVSSSLRKSAMTGPPDRLDQRKALSSLALPYSTKRDLLVKAAMLCSASSRSIGSEERTLGTEYIRRVRTRGS